MAGEQKGKAYEALAKLVLEDLKAATKLKGRIFWDEKPAAMTIVPDLTIGRSANAPDICILITHSGSAKESEKKLWRNMGELVEAKVFLPTQPLVFNLAFDSVVKANLKKVQDASFDGQLIVGDRPYGDELQAWVDSNLKDFPKDKEEKVEHLREVAKKDMELMRLIGLLKKDLEALLKKKSPKELDEIWEMERKRKKGTAPARKETFVRRGLSKLLIFEDVDVALRLYSGQRVKQDEVPEYAYELGLATKAIGRAQPADEEIQNAVSTLGVKDTKSVVAKMPIDKISGWLLALRNAPHLALMGQYVIRHFSELSEPQMLERRLRELHRDPHALVEGLDIPENWPPETVWLFGFILEVLKSTGGNATSYGYAQMAREMARMEGMPGASDRVYSIVLSDWLLRRGKETLPNVVLKTYAELLSGKLRELGLARVERAISELKNQVYSNLIEAKLCTYRGIDPLASEILMVAPGACSQKLQSCFAEKALTGGQAGKTTVFLCRSTLINWQSCSDAGRDHKKKELCGRASSLRYSWDAKNKKFIPRPGVKKLILVIDGTWRQADLDALVRAGWDEIFYPDEMDKLAKAIV